MRGEGYNISDSTIGRTLVRKGLNQRLVSKKKRVKYRIKRLRVSQEIDRQLPGSLVQVDTKYLIIASKVFYQFTAVDVVTRLKYSQIFTSRGSKCGRKFLDSMIKFFPFPVKAVQSDNGSEFLKEFHQELEEYGIVHYFSYPKTPQQNAYVERVIQTDSYEFWYQGNMINDYQLMREYMEGWNYKYNYERPHQALGYQTPWQYYQTLVKDKKGGDDKM